MKKYSHNLKTLILRHLLNKDEDQDQGFALIFLALMLGLVSALVLPSFTNQASKARQSEARTYVGAMNRAQQAYQIENNAFTDSLDKLGLGIRSETDNYSYSIRLGTKAVFNYGTSKRENLKSYVGGVFVLPVPNSSSEYATQAILCETDIPTNTLPSPPTNENGVLTCSVDTKQIGK
jgi:type IV pilus assembly protein PilA